MYGLAVWMHNSPIVPPDLGQKAKRPICPCPLAQTLSGVPLGHGEPWEEEAGLETLTLWPQVVRLPLEGGTRAPQVGMGFCGSWGLWTFLGEKQRPC